MGVLTTGSVKKWVVGILGTIAVLWGFHEWVGQIHLPRHLMSRADAQTLQVQVKEAADKASAAARQSQQTSDTLIAYINRQELTGLRDKLERTRGELQNTLLWESANGGENQISRDRKRDLNGQIRGLEEQIRCTVDPQAPGC